MREARIGEKPDGWVQGSRSPEGDLDLDSVLHPSKEAVQEVIRELRRKIPRYEAVPVPVVVDGE